MDEEGIIVKNNKEVHKASSDRILDAAEQLFSEFGFAGTSIRAIAAQSGSNISLVSYYFGGKEQLFAELLRTRGQFFKERYDQIVGDATLSYTEKVKTMLNVYIEKTCSAQNMTRIMMSEIGLGKSNSSIQHLMHEKITSNRHKMASLIKSGIEAGEFRAVDPEVFAMMMSNCIFGYQTHPQISIMTLGGNPQTDEVNKPEYIARVRSYVMDVVDQVLVKKNHKK